MNHPPLSLPPYPHKHNRNWMNPLSKVINLEKSDIFTMNNEHLIFCVLVQNTDMFVRIFFGTIGFAFKIQKL